LTSFGINGTVATESVMSIPRISTLTLALMLLGMPLHGIATNAGAIKVLCSTALKGVMEELVPRFERGGEGTVAMEFAPSSVLRDRVDAGEPFDVAVLTPALIDEMIKKGRIEPDSRTMIARTGLGLAVRAGARKPDLSTVDAFKRALLDARSITFGTQGASAAPFSALVERLGITAALKPKYLLMTTGATVGEAVADGRAELGVIPVSEILLLRGVDLGGPFPAEVQSYVSTVAAVSMAARDGSLARALIRFLMSPSNLQVYKAKGMERF
jgi:molybdate transport system substrate-binding protein